MKTIFEDTLRVLEIKTGQFDRGKSDIYDLQVELDVNTEIYPIEKDKIYYFSIARNIHGDADAKGQYSSDANIEDSLFDSYEYVMYGKIFECKQADKDKMVVHVSFGGLLMSLKGSMTHLRQLQYDSRIYLMVKRA